MKLRFTHDDDKMASPYLQYEQETEHIWMFIAEDNNSFDYQNAIHDYNVQIQKRKEDLAKIEKYLDFDVYVNIQFGYAQTSAKANAVLIREGPFKKYVGKPLRYEVNVYSKQMDSLNHELFHVADKAGTKDQYSEQKNLNQYSKHTNKN